MSETKVRRRGFAGKSCTWIRVLVFRRSTSYSLSSGSLTSSGASQTLGRSCLVGLVDEPFADDGGHENGLVAVAKRGVERFGVIGLQADVLAGGARHQLPDHRSADALPAVGGHGPHVTKIGVADAVREQPCHAHHAVAVPGDGDMLGSVERLPQR